MRQSLWENLASDVAVSLKGRTLRVGFQKAVVLKASAYGRAEQERGLYRPMLDMKAGDVYCPRIRNTIMLCIVTGQGRTLGGCVRIDGIEINGARHTGPGAVTGALGITVPRSKGSARIVGARDVELSLDTIPLRKPRGGAQKQPPKIKQGISDKALARLLPLIVDRYLADDPPVTFEGYLNALLQECATETELRKKITAK